MLPFLRNETAQEGRVQRTNMGTHSRGLSLSLSIIESDAFERIKEVSDLYVDGVTSPYTIARRLGIKVVEARAAIETWHEIISQDAESKDLARDALHVMLQRYDKLLEEANGNLADLKDLDFDEKVGNSINSTIKLIGDLDSKRVDLLQRAGLLDNNDLADELADREEREQLIIGMLRNDLCPACQDIIRDKITRLTGVVQGDVVDE